MVGAGHFSSVLIHISMLTHHLPQQPSSTSTKGATLQQPWILFCFLQLYSEEETRRKDCDRETCASEKSINNGR